MAGAVINAEARIDDFSIINTHASVDHDCWGGEGAHARPVFTLAGNVRVGSLAFIGAGATVIPGITIGQDATIGAGASVLRDVPDGASAGRSGKIMRTNNQ